MKVKGGDLVMSSGGFSIDPAVIQALKKTVRELSLSRLKYHVNSEDVTLIELQNDPIVHGHWMTLILGAGEDIRITFKVFFTSQAIRVLAGPLYGDKINAEQISDFLREFCNLVVGGLKAFLEDNGIKIGTSLPLVTRGFDEMFFPPLTGKVSWLDKWTLQCGKVQLICSVGCEIFHEIKLNKAASTGHTAKGGVEFF